MSYRKDQGRYARMVAFWGVILLIGYGCFHAGGLVTVLDGFLKDSNRTYVEQFPLVGSLKLSTLMALGLLVASAILIHRVLGRPKVADALIDTEAEMHKVTWPAWPETWLGSLAVGGTVVVLFLFLSAADLMFAALVGFIIK